jgi:hypothetical protein
MLGAVSRTRLSLPAACRKRSLRRRNASADATSPQPQRAGKLCAVHTRTLHPHAPPCTLRCAPPSSRRSVPSCVARVSPHLRARARSAAAPPQSRPWLASTTCPRVCVFCTARSGGSLRGLRGRRLRRVRGCRAKRTRLTRRTPRVRRSARAGPAGQRGEVRRCVQGQGTWRCAGCAPMTRGALSPTQRRWAVCASARLQVVLMTNVASACGYTRSNYSVRALRDAPVTEHATGPPACSLTSAFLRVRRSWLRCTRSTARRGWRSSRGRATSSAARRAAGSVRMPLARLVTRTLTGALVRRSRAPPTPSASLRRTRACSSA